MQSTEKVSLPENGDKSLEWPTLNDVCTNAKKSSPCPNAARKARNHRRRNKSPSEKSGGYDSSKENEASSESSSIGRGARKKSSLKTRWVPVPIVPQPYKKRGNGRHGYDSNRNFNADKKNESSEYANGHENGRGVNMRGSNRFRGKRGRGYSQSWRPRREETSRGEIENEFAELPFESECYFNNTIFYDPYLHNVYATALRDEGLNAAIRLQIEYYFSEDNLVKDIFMRRKMDGQGYVPLSLISTFHRVKNLTKSVDVIIESLKDSSKLELLDNIKVRPVVDPLKWPLPDTFVGLRSDVPEFVPGQPYITTLIEGMDSLNVNVDEVNGDQFDLRSPDSACLSPEVVVDFITDINNSEHVQQNILPYYPESVTSPKHIFYPDTTVIDPYVTNGCDLCSGTPSPEEHVNGFDYYSEQIPNGVIFYTPNVNGTGEQIPNEKSFYYGSSPDDVLSVNSIEDHQEVLKTISPEPTR